jgi:long-chain acyl-CoA synthetase
MRTLADPLELACQVAQDRIAVIDGDTSVTFREFARRCRLLANGLRTLGLERNDRVAILAANRAEYLEAYVGIPTGGFVIVPLNTRHALPELEYALRDSGARVLITDRPAGGLRGLVERVVTIGDEYESLLAAGDGPADGANPVSDSDLAGLFYTGGTTGAAKGVMLTHGNLVANARHWMSTVAHGPADKVLIIAPLFHAAGSNGVLAALWNTGTQITLRAFDPCSALDMIERHQITHTLVVPTMLAAMAEEQLRQPRNTRTLRTLAHGGSPVATEVLRRAAQAMPTTELVEVYGATELSPLATALRDEQTLLDHPRARSCGRAVSGVHMRVVDADGRTLVPGQIGQVVVRGPNVMQGYWNKPDETAGALRNGEYWTGDLGYMDDGGYLFLVDRC